MSHRTIPIRPRALRRRLALIAFGAILAGTGIGIGTGIAKADAGDLVGWAYANGFTGAPNMIVTRGSLVCADLALGDNGEQAARDLWLNTGIVDMSDARRFVVAAVVNLCPQYLPTPASGISSVVRA